MTASQSKAVNCILKYLAFSGKQAVSLHFQPETDSSSRDHSECSSCHLCAVFRIGTCAAFPIFTVWLREIRQGLSEERENIMFRRTLLGTVAVLGLLVMGGGSAFANHGWGGGHHHGGYGYRGGYGYGGYGYRPLVVAPRPVIVAPPMYATPGYGVGGYGMGGCGPGYGGYGYGAPYGAGIGYASPGFGFYMGR